MPSTQYQYVLKSVGTDGKSTDYTEPLAVTTLSDGAMPQITEQPKNISVRPGTDATFSISAIPSAGNNTNGVTYRWQSRTDGGRWTDLNRSSAALTIENVTTGMSGTQYRCIVSQTDLTTQLSAVVYSETATLTVGKAGSETRLSTRENATGGNATYETTGETQKNVAAQYKIGEKTYQKYANAYPDSDTYTLNDDVYGTYVSSGSGNGEYQYFLMDGLSLNGTPDANGVFIGSFTGTAVQLRPTEDRVTLNGTMYKIGADGFRRTQETDGEYTVYTATAVAGEPGQQDTLTLYCKDGTYYRKKGNDFVQMTAADTISDMDTNTYREDSLTEVYKTDTSGYTILTYGSETIYELNGTYYSKNGSTYRSLPVKTGLYESDGKLFKPGAVETTTITVTGSKKQVIGQKVTLTATVGTLYDTTAATNGTVTFEITNTTTGNVTRYTVNKTSGQDEVTCDWTPSEAGVYSIVAIYSGNSQTETSRSSAFIYYAQAEEELYEIEVKDCIYGDLVSPSLKKVTINGSTGSASAENGKSVSYAAYKDGSSDAESWTSGTTLVPGTYRITATENDKVIASKYITVAKKAITVTAPTTLDGKISFDSFVNNDDYASLFKTEGMPGDKAAVGVYNVSVVYNEDASDFTTKQAEFLSKYAPVLRNSMVLVQADTYTVTYSHGNNGELFGYQGGNSVTFESGASIAAGSRVLFSAKPAENYQVSKWTVKSGEQELTEGTDYTLSNDKTTLTIAALHNNLNVQVEFSNQFYTVSAQGGENGSVTATVGGLVTSNYVLSGTEVTFTAAPKDGYVVKQWTVTRGDSTATQKNADGSDFSGKELKQTITANTTVSVTFEASEQYEVHYSAVKQTDTDTIVPLTFETTGLTDGKGEKGSTVTLTAKLSSAMGIVGWEYKTANSDWTSTNISGLSYTIQNLQSDIWVRALVNDSAAPTKVTFGIVDESGASVQDGGTLTAKYAANDAPITSGTGCTTYSTITFTYTEPTEYEVVKWTVNGTEVAANRNGKTFTYTIDSLTATTTVNMVVRLKPIVTIEQPTNGSIAVTYQMNNMPVKPEEDANGVKYVYNGTVAAVTATPSENKFVASKVEAELQNGQINSLDNNENGPKTITNIKIDGNIKFSATFSAKPVVTIDNATNGTISVTGTVNGTANSTVTNGQYVDFNTTLTVTATPGDGYVVEKINGTDVNTDKANGDVTVDGVDVGTEITATFIAKPVVTIRTTENGSGTVAVTGTVNGTVSTVTNGQYVDFGEDLIVTLTPDKRFEVGDIAGASYTGTTDEKSYTIENVQENQTITPVWAAIPTAEVNWSVIDKTPGTDGGTDGTLTASVTRKGMDSYKVTDSEAGKLTVYRDSVVTFAATAADGYKIGVWQLNGAKQDSQPEITITDTTTQTVQVQFDPRGKEVTYGFKADSAASSKHNAQLSAAFTPNGSTDASKFATGTMPYTDGSITFTVSGLDNGYEVEGWYVDGIKQTGEIGTSFTHSVTHDVGMDVQVKIVRKSYTVTFSGTNGTVTAAADGAQLASGNSVVGDTSVTFTATPQRATGYTFDGWTVNREASAEKAETLTLNITENTVVSAAYVLNTVSYAVNYDVVSDGHGTLTAKNGETAFKSGEEQPAGSTIVFTAVPETGYQVKGWYADDVGENEISGTAPEQNSYTIDNLLQAADVYAAFEKIPIYDIKVGTTGRGRVTATVNGTETAIENGTLTVNRHDNVVLTAVPDADQYLTGWTLDGDNKGNGSMTLTLNDVTEEHTAAADFAASQLVSLRTVCGEHGTLSAEAGYGDNLSAIDASSTTGIRVEKGKKVVLKVTPDSNYMVKKWTVNGAVQDNLSNTLIIENLSENTTVEVAFETPLKLYSIPQSGDGYTVSDVKKIPGDYGDANEIRERGTVTFTVAPENGKYLTALKINGTDCLAALNNAGDENKLTVQNNHDGSYTVTVANVTADIKLSATSMQFRTEKTELTLPTELQEKFADTDALKTELRTQVNRSNASVPAANIQYYDIKLQYTKDGGNTWFDATREHFPANGITVEIPYSELMSGLDNSYIYTVIHMFTTDMKGHAVGATESITPVKGANGISFTVDSLSPSAIGWYKAAASAGGGGGGGGAVAATTYVLTFETNGGSAMEKVTKDSGTTVELASYKPTRTGYTFDGWFSDKELMKPVTSVKLTADTTVYAKWTQNGEIKNPFIDVKSGDYFYDAVLWAVEEKITSGTSATTFSPAVSCTRAQMVTFLWRAAGSPKVENVSNPFTDVKLSSYYYDAVLWAIKNGVTSGTSATTFHPDNTVTRGQTVTFLYRNAGSPDVETTGSFTDVAATSYYAQAVAWAVKNGITTGVGNGKFAPDADCTRAQIVTFLYRNNLVK